jgi:uncharacterized SAM-binding protein YcdF (DUF218 family)
MDTFLALKFLGRLALPPASMVLGLIVGGLLTLAGARRLGRTVALGAVLEAAILSLPPVADALVTPLERQASDAAKLAPACCYSAIVLLGGGISPAAPPLMPTSDLNDAADRILFAARLFHKGLAPRIIVSGADARPDPEAGRETDASATRQVLLELGVPSHAIVLEGASRNTGENIAFVRAMVGSEPVALVTSAFHMPRALKLAQQAGLEAFAFPTDYKIPAALRPAWQNWLPGIEAQTTTSLALWEYMGLAFDRRRHATK